MTRRIDLVCLIITITATFVCSEIPPSLSCRILDDAGTKYDFGNLSIVDMKIRNDEMNATIALRLCSPLQNTSCGGKGNSVNICLKKDGRETVIGKPAGELQYQNNTLHFNFKGDKCDADKNYTVQILMKCNYTAKGVTTPQLFPVGEDKCALKMIWNTELACSEAITSDCKATDGSKNQYDLSSLTRYSRNHFVDLDEKGETKMILNICHSVIRENGAGCVNGAGACLANSSNTDLPYESYGKPNAPFIDDNGTLKVVYKNGDLCPIPWDKSSLSHHQTTISFICDPEATDDTEAKLDSESKPCDYKFIWKTYLACNKTVLDQYKANICSVQNPATKARYNFQQLMNQNFTATSVSGTKYMIQVCGPIVGGQCNAENTGICDTNNSASAGTANANLMWQHGGPYLNYTDGRTCGNGQKRYTIIAFVCGAVGSEELPTVVKDEECYVIIHWYRQEACKERISCTQEHDSLNLAPLMKNPKNIIVTESGKEFHINVCNPLVPTPDLDCPHGSAVCQAVKNSKGQYVNETSLGFPDQEPVRVNDRNVILNYSGGSQCPENPNKNLSSSFTFICNYTVDLGEPKYKSYADCHYDFEWRTNTVCGAVVGQWFSPCTIKDPWDQYEVNLSSLYEKQIPRYVEGYGKNYSISICGGKDHCNGSAVCQGNDGYGIFSHVTFNYGNKSITLQYSHGTNCSNGTYASELRLYCNKTAGIGNPVLPSEPNCIASFDWQTNVACPRSSGNIVPESSLTTEKISTDSKSDASVPTWIVSSTIVLVILVIGVWLCLRYPQRCARLKSRINSITSRQNHSRIQYSRVNTTEEARLLLDASDPYNTDGHVDSDDELLGV